ncbi:OadG family transporter subunit [Bilifractor sp. LCP19S3_H10]|uniref:OadG family transporter subunit n=1 Tax=Bilifractor sp. LCP19S3_H10 TaxID=3438736 RepID=UPI003F8E9A2B
MKTMKKKISVLLLLTLCMTFLFSAMPVFASVDEDTASQYVDSVTSFLNQVYTLSDDDLKSLDQNGQGYSVLYDAWMEDRDELGAFKSVDSVSVNQNDSSDKTIVVNAVVSFEHYKSDVTMYFNTAETVVNGNIVPSGLVNYEMTTQYSLGEKMASAAENMAVGLITVFAILIILIVVISLFRFIPDSNAKKAKQSAGAATPKKAEQPAATRSAAVPAGKKSTADSAARLDANDPEIAAVIAAAIAAAMEDNPSGSGYVVRSVRKVGTRRWKRV